jgi:hypothetical protein
MGGAVFRWQVGAESWADLLPPGGGKAPYQEDERECIGDLTTDEEEAPGLARPSLAHVARCASAA